MTDHLLRWQRDVWDTMAPTYLAEAEHRLLPCTETCLQYLALRPGDRVLDLGCGTGALALRASALVGSSGHVSAIDISDEMLTIVRRRAAESAITNIAAIHGDAGKIPLPDSSHDALAASLSLMFAGDKDAAAREIARVLAPGGRIAVSVWASPDRNDLVRFQRIAGSFAPEPPARGVGPGSMSKPNEFLAALRANGIDASLERGEVRWSHPSLAHAWDTFASVTALRMSPDQIVAAKAAISADMWPDPTSPREFRNVVLYLVGNKFE